LNIGINELILKNIDFVQSQVTHPNDLTISPFAVDPYTSETAKGLSVNCSVPPFEVVKKVNSKVYSHQLSKELFENTKGQIVTSAGELHTIGMEFLKTGAFLIKSVNGVSGKGIAKIFSQKLLDNIVKHIDRQEKKGKSTIFLLEPLFDKDIDFSSQVIIDENGDFKLLSIQVMHNKNFGFNGMSPASDQLLNTLEKKGYFKSIELIVQKLMQEGYYGNVCIDSMLLKDTSIIPCVEINARKSMGYINHCLNSRFNGLKDNSELLVYGLGVPENCDFTHFFDCLKNAGLLIGQNSNYGVMPLNSMAFDINKNFENGARQARLYLYAVYSTENMYNNLKNGINLIFQKLKIINYT
jgi:hypothetical protein